MHACQLDFSLPALRGLLCARWYELLEILRKLLLTSLGSAFAVGNKPYTQLTVKIALSLFFLLLFVRHSPFDATEVDLICVTTQLCTLLTLFYALFLRIGFFEAEGISEEVAAVAMLVIQVVPFAVAVCVISWLVRAEVKNMYGDVIEEKSEALRVRARRLSYTFSSKKLPSQGVTVQSESDEVLRT